jgi:hypothetical protein
VVFPVFGANCRLRIKSGPMPALCCATVSKCLVLIPLTRAGVIPVGIRRVSSNSGSFPPWVRLNRGFAPFAAGKRFDRP